MTFMTWRWTIFVMTWMSFQKWHYDRYKSKTDENNGNQFNGFMIWFLNSMTGYGHVLWWQELLYKTSYKRLCCWHYFVWLYDQTWIPMNNMTMWVMTLWQLRCLFMYEVDISTTIMVNQEYDQEQKPWWQCQLIASELYNFDEYSLLKINLHVV